MLARKDVIQEGDWIILYESFENVRSVKVTRGELYSNQFGAYRHNDMIGKPYGSKIQSYGKLAAAPLTMLHPTPQLWTDALSHRTQILFQMDISLVMYHLQLKPGSVVIESGTGSASLTHSLARAVAPHGHVHTFEFNSDRVAKAQVDLERNGLTSVATVRHRDVCANGFPFFPDGVDAVFLDLPTPWLAVDDAHRSLRPQGRLCSFSPCIEQVQRTCVRLAELDYEEIITIEVLQKTIEVHRSSLRPFDFNASRPGIHAGTNPHNDKNKKNKFNNKRNAAAATAGASPSTDSTDAADSSAVAAAAVATEDDSAAAVDAEAKIAKTSTDAAADATESAAGEDVQLPAPAATTDAATTATETATAASTDAVVASGSFWSPLTPVPQALVTAPAPWLVSKPRPVMRGHTGYLTFARKACTPAPVKPATEASEVTESS